MNDEDFHSFRTNPDIRFVSPILILSWLLSVLCFWVWHEQMLFLLISVFRSEYLETRVSVFFQLHWQPRWPSYQVNTLPFTCWPTWWVTRHTVILYMIFCLNKEFNYGTYWINKERQIKVTLVFVVTFVIVSTSAPFYLRPVLGQQKSQKIYK